MDTKIVVKTAPLLRIAARVIDLQSQVRVYETVTELQQVLLRRAVRQLKRNHPRLSAKLDLEVRRLKADLEFFKATGGKP